MTVETKFNIGDRVYVLFNNFIRVAFIIKIIVLKESSLCNIQYLVQIKDQEPQIYNEGETHATSEDVYKYISRYVRLVNFTER